MAAASLCSTSRILCHTPRSSSSKDDGGAPAKLALISAGATTCRQTTRRCHAQQQVDQRTHARSLDSAGTLGKALTAATCATLVSISSIQVAAAAVTPAQAPVPTPPAVTAPAPAASTSSAAVAPSLTAPSPAAASKDAPTTASAAGKDVAGAMAGPDSRAPRVIETGPMPAWVNELHYDNKGADVGEFVELAVRNGVKPESITVLLYNGADGEAYATYKLGQLISEPAKPAAAPSSGPAAPAPATGPAAAPTVTSSASPAVPGKPADPVKPATSPAASTAPKPAEAKAPEPAAKPAAGAPAAGSAAAGTTAATPAAQKAPEPAKKAAATPAASQKAKLEVGQKVGSVTLYTLRVPTMQNGPADGIALLVDGKLVQFISYEGELVATSGPPKGFRSTDIKVEQGDKTPVGSSLGLAGSGKDYRDFKWQSFPKATTGTPNTSQTIS